MTDTDRKILENTVEYVLSEAEEKHAERPIDISVLKLIDTTFTIAQQRCIGVLYGDACKAVNRGLLLRGDTFMQFASRKADLERELEEILSHIEEVVSDNQIAIRIGKKVNALGLAAIALDLQVKFALFNQVRGL